MKLKKIICICLVTCGLFLLTLDAKKTNYKKSYAIVVSKTTNADPQWKKVVVALQKKHHATIIVYNKNIGEALPKLKKIFPKYVCFVEKPENANFAHILNSSRMMRKLDEDPYTDAIFGTITGYTAKDALRMAEATKPTLARTALISAGVGCERFKEAYFLDTGKIRVYGHKTSDGKIERKTAPAGSEMTKYYVNYFNKLDPDIVISSAHASQRNLEMPFSLGNVVCKDGKLYGYLLSNQQMIDYRTGQAKKNLKLSDILLPIKEPKNPKVYFAVGNCLIGDIDKKDCMALAWMGFAKANQMIGYTVTTWYGKMGWGIIKIWEPSGGYAPLNESYFFSNQLLKNYIVNTAPDFVGVEAECTQNRSWGTKLRYAVRKIGKPVSQELFGALYDMDTVAFYGDPALEVFLDKKYGMKAKRIATINKKNGEYVVKIHANSDCSKPTSWYCGPIGLFLPERVKNIKLITGKEFKPVITDNFVLITCPGPFEAGKDYYIRFKADPIK